MCLPGTKLSNRKQALALLMLSRWLHEHMSSIAHRDHNANHHILLENHIRNMIIIGPAGTGKTTVLKSAQAIMRVLCGHLLFHRGAISNTAARLLGGNTLHTLRRLPRYFGAKTRLGDEACKRLQSLCNGREFFFIDEVSIVGAPVLVQIDTRLQQAPQACHV